MEPTNFCILLFVGQLICLFVCLFVYLLMCLLIDLFVLCLLFDVVRSCCSLGLHCERLVRLNLSSCPLLSDQGLIALRYYYTSLSH